MQVEHGKQFPFILVSPQCPADSWWDVEELNELLGYIIEKHRVDADRVYCTGLSMGGYGSWELAARHPERFAAIVPICGGGDVVVLGICRMKHVPVWAFHGARDPVVPIEEDRRLVEALKHCGGSVQFTVYPDVEHNAWTRTYDNPKVFEWMLAQRRARVPQPSSRP